MLERASEHMDVTTLDNILEFYPSKSQTYPLFESIVSQVQMLWCFAMLWKLIRLRRFSLLSLLDSEVRGLLYSHIMDFLSTGGCPRLST